MILRVVSVMTGDRKEVDEVANNARQKEQDPEFHQCVVTTVHDRISLCLALVCRTLCAVTTQIHGQPWYLVYTGYSVCILKHYIVPYSSIHEYVGQNSLKFNKSESSLDTNNNVFRRNLTVHHI